MMNESDKGKLKELHSTRSFTVWHDHSDVCDKASINTESLSWSCGFHRKSDVIVRMIISNKDGSCYQIATNF